MTNSPSLPGDGNVTPWGENWRLSMAGSGMRAKQGDSLLSPFSQSVISRLYARRHESAELRTIARQAIRDAQVWLVINKGKRGRVRGAQNLRWVV